MNSHVPAGSIHLHKECYLTVQSEAVTLIKKRFNAKAHGPATLGLWVDMCNKPNDWVFHKGAIKAEWGMTEHTYNICMGNLRKVGLVWNTTGVLDNGQRIGTQIHISNVLPELRKAFEITRENLSTADVPTEVLLNSTSVETPINTDPDRDAVSPKFGQTALLPISLNPNLKDKPKTYVQTAFTRFHENYPRKQDKKKAEKFFNNIVRGKTEDQTNELTDQMINHVNAMKLTDGWKDPQYIPLPSTYLNNNRWEDQVIQPSKESTPNAMEVLTNRSWAQGILPPANQALISHAIA